MYGLIGRILATPGNRDELAKILVPGDGGMRGCFSYIVATDPQNQDALWVTEVWVDRDFAPRLAETGRGSGCDS